MKKLNLQISLSLLLLILIGCNSEKRFIKLANEHPEWLHQTDSTTIKIDTIWKTIEKKVTLKGDTVYKDNFINVPGPCPSKIHEVVNTGATLKISEKGTTQTDTCKCDSIAGVLKIREATIEQLTREKITKVTPVKELSWWGNAWAKWCEIWGWISLFALIGVAIWKLGPAALKLISKIP